MYFKLFAFEFLLSLPMALAISYAGVSLLKNEFGIKNVGKVVGVITAGLMLVLFVARIVPYFSFKYILPEDPAVKQNQAIQLKNQFLQVIDSMIADPSKVTPASKKELFEKFKDLFPNGTKDKMIYAQNLLTYVDCDDAYFQDALAALKTKKSQKSDKRKNCQDADGAFFNRKKMITEDQSKVNDQIIETIAKGKKIIQDNKEIEINEGILKQNIEQQQRNKDVLKTIFSEAQ